jgi:lysophospholipase L1-like esterase
MAGWTATRRHRFRQRRAVRHELCRRIRKIGHAEYVKSFIWKVPGRPALVIGAASAYSAPKTVLVLGDSLSAEYGLARGTGWVALAEQKLKQNNIDAVVVNASVSGETTSGGRSRLPACWPSTSPTWS